MSQQVTYTLDLTPENADKIDAINRLLIAGYTGSKPSTSKQGKSTTAVDDQNEPDPESSDTTLNDIKNAAKQAKKDHGEDFAMQVLKDAGVDVNSTLGRSMSKIKEEYYDSIIADWEAGPQESDDLDDDDGFDDDDDLGDDAPTADAVKTALKAYAKETGRDEAKELMAKYKIKALSGVSDLNDDQLTKLFAELV